MSGHEPFTFSPATGLTPRKASRASIARGDIRIPPRQHASDDVLLKKPVHLRHQDASVPERRVAASDGVRDQFPSQPHPLGGSPQRQETVSIQLAAQVFHVDRCEPQASKPD